MTTRSEQNKLYSTSRLPSTRLYSSITTNDIKGLIKDDTNITHIMTIILDKEFVPIFSPVFANKDGDDVSPEVPDFYLIGNGTDNIPSKALVKGSATSVNHFLVLVPQGEAGRIGDGLDPKYRVPVGKLTGTAFEGRKDILLAACPSVCPLPYSAKPMYDIIDDSSVRSVFSQNGDEAKLWLDFVRRAIEHKDDTALVYSSLLAAQRKNHVLNYDGVVLNPNGPYSIFSPFNASAVDDDSNLLEKAIKVQRKFTAVTMAPSAPNNVGAEEYLLCHKN
jgi:hypothetical protein